MRFRFRKDSIVDLVNIIQTDLEHQTRRGRPLSPIQRFLIAMRFYASGSFKKAVGDLFGMSVFAACNTIHKVERALAKRKAQFMSFNTGNLGETKRKRYATLHFPGVLGAIYCTHIRTICPAKDNAMTYVNRKQFYLINVEAICDSEACITDIVACHQQATAPSL